MAVTHGKVAVAEAARQAAMLNGDVQALDALLAEDLTWVHASAKQDTRASFIEQFASGRLRCIRLDHTKKAIRPFGTVALATGRVGSGRHGVVAGGGRHVSASLYLAVWVKSPSGLLLVQWRSTRVQPSWHVSVPRQQGAWWVAGEHLPRGDWPLSCLRPSVALTAIDHHDNPT